MNHPLQPVSDILNTSGTSFRELLRRRDDRAILRRVADQLAHGAAALDVNAASSEGEAESMAWLVAVLRRRTDVPLWIDTRRSDAAEAGLAAAGSAAVLNSIPLHDNRVDSFIELARRFAVPVVALCLDERGPPRGSADRIALGRRCVDRLGAAGIPVERLCIDVCLLPPALEPASAQACADAVAALRDEFPAARFTIGIRNLTWSMAPAVREAIERDLLRLFTAVGVDSPMLDVRVCSPEMPPGREVARI